MAAVRHLRFGKFEFFNGRGGEETHFALAYQISLKSVKPLRIYRDFSDFQDGGRRHLEFSKIRNFNDQSAVGGQCASPCQISSKSVTQLQRYGDLTVFIQNGGRPPSWIYWAPTGTSHDDHFVVSIATPNLVKIDAVVSITWKRLFTPPKIGVWGYFTPQMENNIIETPKKHIIARVHVVWEIKRENPSTGLTCRWVPEKRYNVLN